MNYLICLVCTKKYVQIITSKYPSIIKKEISFIETPTFTHKDNFILTLTFDLDRSCGDSLAKIVVGAAHVDAFVVSSDARDIKSHVAKVVSAVDA